MQQIIGGADLAGETGGAVKGSARGWALLQRYMRRSVELRGWIGLEIYSR